MVINFSNALLQSSVNSFGSTEMAGYTAANNLLGFLYMSINSVTQACMSFTSQNFGVGKYKRMDRVLKDCLILTMGIALVLGCGFYIFGPQILKIYTRSPKVIESAMEILSITTVPYFLCGIMDLFPGALRGMGYSVRADDTFSYWYGRNKNCMDLWTVSNTSITVFSVYFLSGIVDCNNRDAGDLLCVCETDGAWTAENRVGKAA